MGERAWREGVLVGVRGRPWRVAHVEPWPDCTVLSLDAAAPRPRTLRVLLPFDRPHVAPPAAPVSVLRLRRWRHALADLESAAVPFGGPSAGVQRAIRLLPYQFEPLLAVTRLGAARLLVADEVGLGKTIQAGLILAELAARSSGCRALVVVPAGLRDQWQRELASRFGISAAIADAAWLRGECARLPVGLNPWSQPGALIASMDFAKRPEVLAAVEDLTWDLVVVDEAHLVSAATDRRVALHAICRRARHAVLMTATPHLDDPEAYRALCEIGRSGTADAPIVAFTRTRARVAPSPPRRQVFQRVRLGPAEHHAHALLARYASLVWAHAAVVADGEQARLAALVLRKRALSGAASLATSVGRRLERLTTAPSAAAAEPRQPGLPLGAEQDDEPIDGLEAPGLPSRQQEIRWLGAIHAAAVTAARTDSKERWLMRFAARVREPVLVFTEYRDTLLRLAARLARAGHAVGVLHGGLEPAERRRVQEAFNDGALSLVATDVAAEGLNLQRRCRVLIHYELPWTLSRMVQRAGRIDRLGQHRRVHEVALVADATAERLVVLPLARRAAAAARLGPAAGLLPERQLGALVMGETVSWPAPGPPGPPVSRAVDLSGEAAREVARLARATVPPGTARRLSRRGLLVSSLARRAARAGFDLVFEVGCRTAQGERVHAELVVVDGWLVAGAPGPTTAAAARRLCAALDDEWRRDGRPLADVLRRCAAAALARVAPLRDAWVTARRLRETAVARPGARAAPTLVQPGLFDARSLRAAEGAAALAAERAQESAVRLAALSPDGLSAEVSLRAVLLRPGPGPA